MTTIVSSLPHARTADNAGHHNNRRPIGRGFKQALAGLFLCLFGLSAEGSVSYSNTTPLYQVVVINTKTDLIPVQGTQIHTSVNTTFIEAPGQILSYSDQNYNGGGQSAVGTVVYTLISATSIAKPTATISATSTSVALGQSTVVNATFTYDSADGDTLTNTNIDLPAGTPAPGQDGSAQTTRAYSFTPSATGSNFFAARVNTKYYGWDTYATVEVDVGTPPSITSQPAAVIVTAGNTASFTVSANAGSGPGNYYISYQWQVSTNNGLTYTNLSNVGSYSGTTTTKLTVSSPTTGMNGNLYQCVASNPYGPDTNSVGAKLTVTPGNPVSIITQPVSPSVPAEQTGFALTVAVSSSSTPPITYQWRISKDGGNTWNNVPSTGFTGATTSTLTYTGGIFPAMNGYQYDVVVSNNWGSPVTSNAAVLTVTAALPANPDVPAMPTWALVAFALLILAVGQRFFHEKRTT